MDKLCGFMNDVKSEIIEDYDFKINRVLNVFKSPDIFIKMYDKSVYEEINALCLNSNKSSEQFFKIYFSYQIDDINKYLEDNLEIESNSKLNPMEGTVSFNLRYNDIDIIYLDIKNRFLKDNLGSLKENRLNSIKENIKELTSKNEELKYIYDNQSFKNLRKEFSLFSILFKKNECIDSLNKKIDFIQNELLEFNKDLLRINNEFTDEERKSIEVKNKLFKLGFSSK